MSKRLIDGDLEFQENANLTLQDIEENSIEQLVAQSSPAFKQSLKKLLIANNEEIARLANFNKKILECLERIDQQEQENFTGVPGCSAVAQQNQSKVGLISIILFSHIFFSEFSFGK
jgi:hypothetical protein